MKKKKKIECVYVVGPLTPKGYNSSHPAIDYLLNIRNLTRYSLEVFFAGFDPFCPALDFLFFLLLRDDERLTEAMIKRFSKAWMARSDALYLTPGWKQSGGSLAEVKRAKELGMPIFNTIQEMIDYNKSNGYEQE
jgi:hypothetical protein